MDTIKKILNILRSNSDIEILIGKLGVIQKVIGNRFFLTPFESSIKAISISGEKKDIKNIGITLNHGIGINKIIDFLRVEYTCLFNNYDSETTISFIYDNQFRIMCFIDGYIDEKELGENLVFRFKIECLEK